MKQFGLIAVFMASPLWAQELPYSNAATLQCLQTADGYNARSACIGLSSSACMNSELGGSTVGMGGCLDAELQLWDGMLNQHYKAAMAQATQADIDNAQVEYNLPSQATALRDMQRAWIPFRDASCDYERSKWGGGTGGGPATLACLLDLTARQALALVPEVR